jgi:hypothetical protein
LDSRFVVFNNNKLEHDHVPDTAFISAAAELRPGETRNHTVAVSHIAPWSVSGDDREVRLERELLASLGVRYTIHAHRHRFAIEHVADLDLTEFVVADSKGTRFGLATVRPDAVTFEFCSPACVDARP